MVKLFAQPQYHFTYSEGVVNDPVWNTPPGPFKETRTNRSGLSVPLNLWQRKVWLAMEINFLACASGFIIFRKQLLDLCKVPWQFVSGALAINLIDTTPTSGASTITNEDTLSIDLPSGGYCRNAVPFSTVLECDEVSWEIDDTRLNTAGLGPWRFLLAVASCNRW